MTWFQPYHILMHMVCMVTPRGKTCSNYLRQTHGDCYLNLEFNMLSITRLPHWLWRRVINRENSDDLLVDTSRPECLPLLYQANEPNYFSIFYVMKLIMLVAVTFSLLYGIMKVAGRRSRLR